MHGSKQQIHGRSPSATAARWLPRVRRLARFLASRAPGTVPVEELEGAGALGLAVALQRCPPQDEKQLDAYLYRRVHGAMLDELRALDPLSRRSRQKLRELARKAEDGIGAADLPARDAQLYELRSIRHRPAQEALDTAVDRSGPDEQAHARVILARVRKAARRLSLREQQVLDAIFDGAGNSETARRLRISESRATQIRGQIARKLRAECGLSLPPSQGKPIAA